MKSTHYFVLGIVLLNFAAFIWMVTSDRQVISTSIDSAVSSLEAASDSLSLAGEAARTASGDFGAISQVLEVVSIGLFNPAEKYEASLEELGVQLVDTGDHLEDTAAQLQDAKDTSKNMTFLLMGQLLMNMLLAVGLLTRKS